MKDNLSTLESTRQIVEQAAQALGQRPKSRVLELLEAAVALEWVAAPDGTHWCCNGYRRFAAAVDAIQRRDTQPIFAQQVQQTGVDNDPED
jgi:hypothetical protein